jgi:ribosome biogenesis GTPase
MHPLPFGGFLIDTPGIRELGVFDLLPQELGRLFPELRSRMSDCKFHNCQHINEPGCAVLKALEAGEIEPSRYDSYLSIYHGNETRV